MGHKEVRLSEEFVEAIASLELDQMLQLRQHLNEMIAQVEEYSKLRELLAAGKWKEADQETKAVMLKLAHREKEGWLNPESIEKLSSSDLLTIDNLWVQYSKGRFGFSVQKQIWLSLRGEYQFGSRVGWRTRSGVWRAYNELTFSSAAPVGHLPSLIAVGAGPGRAGVSHLLYRVETHEPTK